MLKVVVTYLFMENLSQSDEASSAIWDHRVILATRQAIGLSPFRQVDTQLTYPKE